MSEIGCVDQSYVHAGTDKKKKEEKEQKDGDTKSPKDNSVPKRQAGNAAIIRSITEARHTLHLIQQQIIEADADIMQTKLCKALAEELTHASQEARAAISGRPKIARNTHHIWKQASFVQHGLRKISMAYLQARIGILDAEALLDSKQARKYAKGLEPEQMEAYKPRTQEDALYRGYLGVSCEKCGSYKVQSYHSHTTDARCEDCKLEQSSGIIMVHHECGYIFTDGVKTEYDLEYNNAECPRCKNVISGVSPALMQRIAGKA